MQHDTNSMLPYEATSESGLVGTLNSHSSVILYRGSEPYIIFMVPSTWENHSTTYSLSNGTYHVSIVPRNPFSFWVPPGFLTNTLAPVMHVPGHSVPVSHFSWNWTYPVINHIPRFSEEHHGPSHMPLHGMPLRTFSPRMNLLAIQDRVEDVSAGLSREVIFARMKCIKYQSTKISTSDNDTCCICLNDFSYGQDIGSTNCQHTFHADCISQWLMLKNSCPLCKRIALGN